MLDAGRRGRVLQALTAAGIPYTPTLSGGQPTLVRLSHIWVEAYLPYANYRGVGSSPEGKQWVALDAAIPGGAKYAATPAALDALAAMNVDAQALTSGYLLDGVSPSPLDYYRAQVRSYLTASAPGVDYSSTLRRVSQRTEQLDLLPGSLPYTVISVQEESAFLPDAMKHRVRVTAGDGAGLFVDVTLPLHQLVAHRSVLAYQPATDTDVILIQQNGGALYGAPATLVQVVASIRVDGEEKAVGSRGIPLGADTSWSLELLLPNGTSRRIDNSLIAGNTVALGLGGPFNRYTEPAAHIAGDKDGFAQRFLYARAVAYANEWTTAEEELAALSQVVLVRPTANVAFVQNQLHVESTLGVRQRVEFRGLEIDADLRTVVPLELVTGRARTLLELSGHQGSFLEAKVLKDGIGEKAISATEVVREANRRGTEVLQLSQANLATELPRLSASSEVLRDVADQVALGREVTIPISPLTIENWAGSGYISVEPGSREGGYFLSGIVSGGTSVISPRFWNNRVLAQQLEQNPVASETDVRLIARIIRAGVQDNLAGVVGQPLSGSLVVLVTTLEGTPVVNAPVIFRRTDNGIDEPRLAAPGSAAGADTWGATYSTTTNASGYAYAGAKPDTTILRADGATAILVHGDPNDQLLGMNHVTAETCIPPPGFVDCSTALTKIVLAHPFAIVGKPDVIDCIGSQCRFRRCVTNADCTTGFCDSATESCAECGVSSDCPSERPVCHTGLRQCVPDSIPTTEGVPGMDLGTIISARARDKYGNYLANQSVVWSGTPATGRFVAQESAARTQLLDIGSPLQFQTLTTSTSTLGVSHVGWIAGPTPGVYFLQAASGGKTGVEGVLIEAPPEFVLRMNVAHRESFDGIFNTSLPTPLSVQVLRTTNGGASWAPVSGSEPDIAELEVLLQTMDLRPCPPLDPTCVPSALNGGAYDLREVRRETAKPTDTTPSPAAALRDGYTSVFWPKYAVEGGLQQLKASAKVIQWKVDPSGNPFKAPACCAGSWSLFAQSSLVEVKPVRRRVGFATEDASAGASVADLTAGFKVGPGSSSKTWARISQHPRVAGQALVQIPDATAVPRHPSDATLFELFSGLDTLLEFNVFDGTSGGDLTIEIFAAEATTPASPPVLAALAPTAITRVVLLPPGSNLVVRNIAPATVILPVRNYASTATPNADAGFVAPPSATELPIISPAIIGVMAAASGRLTVRDGMATLAEFDVNAGVLGVNEATVITGPQPKIDPVTHELRVFLPSDSIRTKTLNVTLAQPPVTGQPDETQQVDLKTTVDDMGALPVGHVFVKDVSVVDGHLVKQGEDLRVPGRGPPLALSHTYTNRGFAEGSMGQGWSHSLESEVIETFSAGFVRELVVGGEGTGQAFNCDLGVVNCRTQVGYHGSISGIPTATGGPPQSEIVYRARKADPILSPG